MPKAHWHVLYFDWWKVDGRCYWESKNDQNLQDSTNFEVICTYIYNVDAAILRPSLCTTCTKRWLSCHGSMLCSDNGSLLECIAWRRRDFGGSFCGEWLKLLAWRVNAHLTCLVYFWNDRHLLLWTVSTSERNSRSYTGNSWLGEMFLFY